MSRDLSDAAEVRALADSLERQGMKDAAWHARAIADEVEHLGPAERADLKAMLASIRPN